MRKPYIASFAVALLAGLIGVGEVGVNLGGAFVIVVAAGLVLPIVASTFERDAIRPALIASILASLGGSIASVGLFAGQGFTVSQVASVALTAFAVSLANAALVRLLIAWRCGPWLSAGVILILTLALFAWPIWLSPWLSGLSSDWLTTNLVAVHPLLAINAVVPQFGYWIQSPQMYRLTALGQDVLFTSPDGVTKCVLLHIVIAVVGFGVLLIVRRRGSGNRSILV